MSIDSVRKHLRAALDEIISSEKKRLHDFYDESDASIARRVELMRPVITALAALRSEVGEVKGLTISTANHGHMATIGLKGGASDHTLSISTAYDNTQFQIEERTYNSFDDETDEKLHNLATADEVLERVLEAVGKHVASTQVLHERHK